MKREKYVERAPSESAFSRHSTALAVIIAAVLLSGTLFIVGSDISNRITGFAVVDNTGDSGNTDPTPVQAVEFGKCLDSGKHATEVSMDLSDGQKAGVTGTPAFLINGTLVSGAQPFSSFQQIIEAALDGTNDVTDSNVNLKLLEDDDAVLGDPNAPVTIIEFSDFQCSFCARFHSQTLPQIKSQYIDTGKVKLIYRDFPLHSIHPDAQKAAEAAECAGDQGKYYEYHDLLFSSTAFDDASLKQYAVDLGLE